MFIWPCGRLWERLGEVVVAVCPHLLCSRFHFFYTLYYYLELNSQCINTCLPCCCIVLYSLHEQLPVDIQLWAWSHDSSGGSHVYRRSRRKTKAVCWLLRWNTHSRMAGKSKARCVYSPPPITLHPDVTLIILIDQHAHRPPHLNRTNWLLLHHAACSDRSQAGRCQVWSARYVCPIPSVNVKISPKIFFFHVCSTYTPIVFESAYRRRSAYSLICPLFGERGSACMHACVLAWGVGMGTGKAPMPISIWTAWAAWPFFWHICYVSAWSAIYIHVHARSNVSIDWFYCFPAVKRRVLFVESKKTKK